jgi:hypothetical protein
VRDARAGLGAIASELAPADGELVDLAGRRAPAELPRRGCSARSIRCCTAGRRARTSSGPTGASSPSTGSSARSPWSRAAPWRRGRCPPAASSWRPLEPIARRSPPRSTGTRRTSERFLRGAPA